MEFQTKPMCKKKSQKIFYKVQNRRFFCEPQTTTNEAYDIVREAGVDDDINEAYEAVRVVEEETNVDCRSGLHTTTNVAYNTARQIGEEPDDEYEFPESITLEHQPTTARDSVYAQVRHGAEPDSV